MRLLPLRNGILAALLSLGSSVQAQAQVDSVVTIPMVYDRHIWLQAAVGDSACGRFAFDSGAELTLLDSGFVARHRMHFGQSRTVDMVGYGNLKRQAQYITDTIYFSVGGHRYASSPNVSANFEQLMPGVDGLLNANLFCGHIFSIDYAAGTFRILPRSSLDSLRGWEKIPIRINRSNFIVLPLTVVIDSARRRVFHGEVHVDTGDPGTLTLNPPRKQMRRWRKATPRHFDYEAAVLGANGGGRVRMIRTQALSVGFLTVPMSNTGLHTDGALKNSVLLGAVGNGFLSQFGSVIFDLRDGALYLPRGRQFTDKDPVNYSGFGVSWIEHWFINALTRHHVGVRQGDTVTHIDRQPVDSLYRQKRLDEYYCTPDRRYTLTVVRDGQTLEIPVTNLNDKTLWH